MAKAKKLPSGSWRVRVLDPETGKYKSFTTKVQGLKGKHLVEAEALDYVTGRKPRPLNEQPLRQVIGEYIELKENILSPTTIDKYRNILNKQLGDLFLDTELEKVTGITIQKEINRLSGIYSPKTVYNAHGLISAAIKTFYPQLVYKVTLPKRRRRTRQLPTAETIISIFKGTEMELIVLLAMWQGFRASEIRGLKKSDFRDGRMYVERVVVTVAGKAIEKPYAKTENSIRDLRVPSVIQDLVDKVEGEYITELSGDAIYKRFVRRMKAAGYNDVTFHDLRHLNASVMLMLGVPDKYAMERGGWSTTSTLKRVYQETFTDERVRIDDLIDTYFQKVYDDTPAIKYDTA
ncbi:MAG: site-specific integrase [Ruminococcus sp.]|nr:site-specific integrase [Ruminococcus sp.]